MWGPGFDSRKVQEGFLYLSSATIVAKFIRKVSLGVNFKFSNGIKLEFIIFRTVVPYTRES